MLFPAVRGFKRLGETMAVVSGATAAARRLSRGDVRILAYHNVKPDDVPPVGDCSLHLSRSDFAVQLDILAEVFEIVPLDQCSHEWSDVHERPRAVITFDDCYRGAVTTGAQELASRDLPATFFVSPALLGGEAFWWDQLGAVSDEPSGLSESIRSQALSQFGGRQKDVVAALIDPRQSEHLPEWALPCSRAELMDALGHAGLTVGSHSWSHPNLLESDEEELRRELEKPLRWLRENFPQSTIPWISYPYGLTSSHVIREARSVGYDGGIRVLGRSAHSEDPVLALPRINVPRHITRNGFLLRVSGLPIV